MLLFTGCFSSCEAKNEDSGEEILNPEVPDEEDTRDMKMPVNCKDNDDAVAHFDWTTGLKLKSGLDEDYLETKYPEIETLIAKHDVLFCQSYPGFSFPVFLLYYTLSGNGDREHVIEDFLSVGIFDYNVRGRCAHFACGVRLKLKPQTDENYLVTKDPEIWALILKHDIIFRQANPGAKDPELLLFYVLEGNGRGNMVNVVIDILSTGKFEYDFYDFEEAHPHVVEI
jgi:hypothetical protein